MGPFNNSKYVYKSSGLAHSLLADMHIKIIGWAHSIIADIYTQLVDGPIG
jgi:hypothetical protein